MIEFTNFPMDESRARALIRATQKRVLEEQDVLRERIASLDATVTPKAALEKIRAMGAEEFVDRLGEIRYPVSWQDRREIASDDPEWDDFPLEKQYPEARNLSIEIQGSLLHCLGIIEQRDRLKALATFYELLGIDPHSDRLPKTHAARRLGQISNAFVGWKSVEEMLKRAIARSDDGAIHRFTSLSKFARGVLLALMPTEDMIATADKILEPESPEIRKAREEVLAELAAMRRRLHASKQSHP